jgi:hypothetical protein
VYRGYYRGGVYLGLGSPYAYGYDPGYVYPPAYSVAPYGPAPAPQTCTDGSYDQYGNWVPSPNCYSGQQLYPPAQQNYDPNQQPYPQPQQNYDPNQQDQQPPQQNYYPNQQQPYQQPQRYNR